jgi:hypothetical protein
MTAEKARPKPPRPVSIDLSHSSTKRREPKTADDAWGYATGIYVPKKIMKTRGGRGVPNKRQTSPSVASKAGRQLASKSETRAEKSVAASALAQTKSRAGGKKK